MSWRVSQTMSTQDYFHEDTLHVVRKICTKCGIEKDMDEFHHDKTRKDSRQSYCIECRKSARDWEQKNRERYNARMRKYIAEHMDTVVERTQRYRRNNPEKWKAHWTVRNAIRDKRLERQPCVVCGNKETDGHHEDYSKPLDVMWLCRLHHRALHLEEINGNNY